MWAGDGSVTRTAGIAEGGRRVADLWSITDVDDAPVDADQVDDDPAGDTDSADTAQADPITPVDADPTDTGATDQAETEPANDSAATDGDTAKDGVGDEKPARLAPGGLRGMVEDYLRDHPGEEFGPTAIARALGGKSSGAVSNALDKLVEDKTAVKTKESPRRFAPRRSRRLPPRRRTSRTAWRMWLCPDGDPRWTQPHSCFHPRPLPAQQTPGAAVCAGWLSPHRGRGYGLVSGGR
jgi:hypothetical protein